MTSLIWHVFFLVWMTGVGGVGVVLWVRRPAAREDRELREQAIKTRVAELQARERRALDSAR